VVGLGGVGAVLAAHLLELGVEVTGLTRSAVLADAVRARGYLVRGESTPKAQRGPVRTRLSPRDGLFDWVFLATYPSHAMAACAQAAAHVAESGRVVSFTGAGAELATVCGAERLVSAIAAWTATSDGLGGFERTSSGPIALGGRLDDASLGELAAALEAVGPVTIAEDLGPMQWSKLVLDPVVGTLGALSAEPLGVLLQHAYARRLALDAITEGVAVARAARITIEPVPGTLDLDAVALTPDEQLARADDEGVAAKHALLRAVGARHRWARSRVGAAIERGEPSAAAFTASDLVRRGAEHGVPTPTLTALRDGVDALERGRARASLDALAAVFRRA
jgi:2-dehydropantoate 2-reductase